MHILRSLAILSSATILLGACSSDDGSGGGDPSDAGLDATHGDSGSHSDSGPPEHDAGPSADSGSPDASAVDAAHDAADASPTTLSAARVLLLSIDGMHQVDLAKYVAAHPTSALAKLAASGVEYTNAWVNALDGTPTNPTDS